MLHTIDRDVKLIHVMTKFTNWDSMSYESFLEQDISHMKIPNPRGQLLKVLDFIKLWDDLYDLSFFQFRKGLSDIAASTFESMKFDETIELRNLNDYAQSCQEQCYFMISDDDDWYNPSVASVLRGSKEDVVSWDDIAVLPNGVLEYRSSRNGRKLWTNSYAITKKCYLTLKLGEKGGLKHHAAARNILFNKHKSFSHKFLSGDRHSVACKTPASYCKYANFLGNKARSKKFLLNQKKHYVPPKSPIEAQWAKSQFNELAFLYECLFGMTDNKGFKRML